MARTTTTLSGAVIVDQNSITVASATGFAANMFVLVDHEVMQVASSYLSGTSIPVLRGREGTATTAHATTTNVTVYLASDSAGIEAQEFVTYPIAGRARKLVSYSATGAIALPLPGNDLDVQLNGTVVCAMTLAVPTKDMDGVELNIVGNGKAAHTVTSATAFGNAGAGYTILTFAAGGQIWVKVKASNGIWCIQNAAAIAGTMTNLLATVS